MEPEGTPSPPAETDFQCRVCGGPAGHYGRYLPNRIGSPETGFYCATCARQHAPDLVVYLDEVEARYAEAARRRGEEPEERQP